MVCMLIQRNCFFVPNEIYWVPPCSTILPNESIKYKCKSQTMNLNVLIAIFWCLPLVESIKVYEFLEENQGSSDVSYISLNLSVSIEEKAVVCSSHKQRQSNLNTTTLYTIYKDKEYTSPWFSVGFWDNTLWAQENLGIWHLLGDLDKKTDFISWINMCIEIDFKKRKLSVSLNGRNTYTAETSLKTLEKIDKFYIR